MTRWSLILFPAHRFPILWMPRKKKKKTSPHLAPTSQRMTCGAVTLWGQMVGRYLFPYLVWCKEEEKKITMSEPTYPGRLAPHPAALASCLLCVVCPGAPRRLVPDPPSPIKLAVSKIIPQGTLPVWGLFFFFFDAFNCCSHSPQS